MIRMTSHNLIRYYSNYYLINIVYRKENCVELYILNISDYDQNLLQQENSRIVISPKKYDKKIDSN